MRTIAVSGKTVESAVSEALRQLKISRDRAEVTVKLAPSKGLWGFGARDAQVEVAVIEDPIGDAERFLREMFVSMRLAVRVSKRVNGADVLLQLSGDRVGMLIGKHGQTLNALQYLVNAVGNKYADKHYRFTVDAEGYRERRNQALVYTALKSAEKAIALGREVMLEPMGSQERKVIHVALQGRQDVHTESRGIEPDRAIVIIPEEVHRVKNVVSRSKMGSRGH